MLISTYAFKQKRLCRKKIHETVRLNYIPEPEPIPQANRYHFGDYKRQEHALCLDKNYRTVNEVTESRSYIEILFLKDIRN